MQSSEKEMQYFLEIITFDLSIYLYTIDHSDFIVLNFMEFFIGLFGLILYAQVDNLTGLPGMNQH